MIPTEIVELAKALAADNNGKTWEAYISAASRINRALNAAGVVLQFAEPA